MTSKLVPGPWRKFAQSDLMQIASVFDALNAMQIKVERKNAKYFLELLRFLRVFNFFSTVVIRSVIILCRPS
jgi:hypothetical protein